jgi:uncharacterized caspase-like protein
MTVGPAFFVAAAHVMQHDRHLYLLEVEAQKPAPTLRKTK